MMKDIRKALGTFWGTQFLQSVIFEDFDEKPEFPSHLNFQAFASRSAFCFFACCAIRLGVYSVAVNGRVLRTPLGHDLCSCHEQSRFWHGRGIIKYENCSPNNLSIDTEPVLLSKLNVSCCTSHTSNLLI